MGLNVLGGRKTRAIGRATGLPVIRAWVWSHHESGRYAIFTTADHQHGYLDRRTGDVALFPAGEPGVCTSYCAVLFPEQTTHA